MGEELLVDMKIAEFVDAIASKTPSPGGGSVAALSGALSAGLVSMVCQLTIDKKGYEDVNEEMKKILKEARELQKELLNLVDEDAKVYYKVVDAFKLPKNTEEERNIRSKEIQEALKKAAAIPLNCAKNCQKVMELAKFLTKRGNVNAISDSGVAAAMANSGIFGAALNVKINLISINDENFKKEKEEELNKILTSSKDTINEIFKTSL